MSQQAQKGVDGMDGPQKDLIEQIVSASLTRQSNALQNEIPTGERPPNTSAPVAPPSPEEKPASRAQPPPQSTPPPKAGRGLVWLTAALAVASAILLTLCLMQFRASRESVDGLREMVETVQSVDQLLEENEQLQQELSGLQAELNAIQTELNLETSLGETRQMLYRKEHQTAAMLWDILLARELFDTGSYEDCAAILHDLAQSRQKAVNQTTYLNGKTYDAQSILNRMAEELGELGYLSQQDIELLGSSFVELLYGDPVKIADGSTFSPWNWRY